MQRLVALREQYRPTSEAVFRVLFSLIFIVAGLQHLGAPQQVVTRLLSAPVGALLAGMVPPLPMVLAAGVALLAGGLSLLLGLRVRLMALILAGVLVPITLTVQTAPGAQGALFKNIALFAGLIHFAFAGAGAFALDNRRARLAATAGGLHGAR